MYQNRLKAGVAGVVFAALVQPAHAAWMTTAIDGLYGNTANWDGGTITNQFSNNSNITAITVDPNRGVNSGTVGVTVNGPFSISATTAAYVFSGGIFSAGSGASFAVTSAATANQTINTSIFQGSRTNAANKVFDAAGSGGSKFIINGNYNYQTTAASGVTTAGVSDQLNFKNSVATGYGVFNGIIANGNAAANGAGVAGNAYIVRTNAGTWEFNGANTFSGGVEFSSNVGSITIAGNKTAFGSGALRVIGGGPTGITIQSNTDLSGANALANTINYVGTTGAATTTSAALTFVAGSNTATLTGGTSPAVGDLITSAPLGTLPLYTRVIAVSGSTITLSNNAAAAGSLTVTTAPFNSGGSGTVTIGGATNIEFSGTQNLTTTAASNGLAATQTFNVTNSALTTFSGTLQEQAGIASVTKSGTGTLVLSGSNTYTGTTTIGSGSLRLGAGGTTGSLSAAGTIVNNANFTINRGNATVQGTDFSSAAITGSGSFTQAGTGTTTLNAANTYSGLNSLTGGTLNVNGITAVGGANYGGMTFNGGGLQYAATLVSSGDITRNSAGVAKAVTFTQTATIDTNGNSVTYQSPVGNGGTGGLTKTGAGSIILTAPNTYAGPTVITTGTIQLGNGGASGSIPSAGTVSLGGGGNLTINRSNTVVQGSDFSSAPITGAGSITHAGTGLTFMSAINTYSGGTNVTAGTLRASNATSSFGTGTTVISGGGIVTGNSATGGPVALGAVTVNGNSTTGGIITAGSGGALPVSPSAVTTDTPATLNTGAETWGAGGTYRVKFFNSAGTSGLPTGYDRLNMPTLNLAGLSSSNTFKLVLLNSATAGFNTATAGVFTIAHTSGAVTLPTGPGTAGAVLTGLFDLDVSNVGLTNPSSAFTVTLATSGSGFDLQLNYSPTPEPASLGLVGLGMSALLGLRRRRSVA